MAISFVVANLATVCLESFLYGIFFVLALASTYFLVQRESQTVRSGSSVRLLRWPALKSPMVIGMVCLFVGNTMHWILTVIRVFKAFVFYKGGEDPTAFYIDLPQPTMVALTGAMIFCLAVGDAMIIYRLWVVWGYNYPVAVIPVICLLGFIAGGIGVTYEFSIYNPHLVIFQTTAGRWVVACFTFTLCTNVYSTALIVWKIWRVNTIGTKYGLESLMGVLVVVVESAAIYTSWTIVYFAAFEARSELQNIVSETLPAVAGISFTLINVRAGMGWTRRAAQSQSHNTSSVAFAPAPPLSHRESFSMRPVQVRVDVKRVGDDCEEAQLPSSTKVVFRD